MHGSRLATDIFFVCYQKLNKLITEKQFFFGLNIINTQKNRLYRKKNRGILIRFEFYTGRTEILLWLVLLTGFEFHYMVR